MVTKKLKIDKKIEHKEVDENTIRCPNCHKANLIRHENELEHTNFWGDLFVDKEYVFFCPLCNYEKKKVIKEQVHKVPWF